MTPRSLVPLVREDFVCHLKTYEFCNVCPKIQYPHKSLLSGGGVLNFHFGMDVRPEGPKMGACRTDRRQIWGLAELIFWQKCCLQNWFLAQMRLPELDFWPIFRLRNWKFTKFRHFEQKIGKFCDFLLKWGLVELKNAEKGVLWSGWGSVKRGSLPPDIPVTLFKVSTPPGLLFSLACYWKNQTFNTVMTVSTKDPLFGVTKTSNHLPHFIVFIT